MKRLPIVTELRSQGWQIEPTRNGHIRATHPQASGLLILSSSPSDWRADRNSRARARRLLSTSSTPEEVSA